LFGCHNSNELKRMARRDGKIKRNVIWCSGGL
jgi:translation initiation factor IF-1